MKPNFVKIHDFVGGEDEKGMTSIFGITAIGVGTNGERIIRSLWEGETLRIVPIWCDLHVLLEVALEGSEEDLPLGRLEPVDHVGDRPLHVVLAVLHELLVDEVGVLQPVLVVVDVVLVVRVIDPFLAVVGTLLVEDEVDGLCFDILIYSLAILKSSLGSINERRLQEI